MPSRFAGGAYWVLSGPSAPPNSPPRSEGAGSRRATGPPKSAESRAEFGEVVSDPTPEPLAPLHCDVPAAVAARWGANVVRAAEVCAALESKTGSRAVDSPGQAAAAAAILAAIVDDRLIEEALLARRRSVTPAELDHELEALSARPGGLGVGFEPGGEGVAQLRSDLRGRLARARLVADLPAASPEALQAEFDRDPARFGKPASALVRGYLHRLPAGALETDVATALAAGERLAAALTAGNAADGGDAPGYGPVVPFRLDALGLEPALEALAFGSGADSWLGPVRTRAGVLVFRATEHVDAVIPRLADVAGAVRVAAEARARAEGIEGLLAALRSVAAIDFAPISPSPPTPVQPLDGPPTF